MEGVFTHKPVVSVHISVRFLAKQLHKTAHTRRRCPNVLDVTLQRFPVRRVYEHFAPVLVAPHCRLLALCSPLYAAKAAQQAGRAAAYDRRRPNLQARSKVLFGHSAQTTQQRLLIVAEARLCASWESANEGAIGCCSSPAQTIHRRGQICLVP
jgi:hypothetical protein